MPRHMGNYVLNAYNAERNYYVALMDSMEDEEVPEMAFVGAGIGSGIQSTTKLRVMKFKEAMESDDRQRTIAESS